MTYEEYWENLHNISKQIAGATHRYVRQSSSGLQGSHDMVTWENIDDLTQATPTQMVDALFTELFHSGGEA